MILTVISWLWIGVASLLCGFAGLKLLFFRKKEVTWGIDLCFISGLCVLTVYAQTFSLFYKIGAVATGLLLCICVGIGVVFFRDLKRYMGKLFKSWKPFLVIISAIIGLICLQLTVQYAIHYDTDLYHAQSIRWIEEYGVVKGLGNLHNRFAYNSAFFCLQALFSLKFAVNRSLHTMNGFITAFMLIWAVASMNIFHRKKIVTSDLFKAGVVFYIVYTEARYVVSSSGSDILALTLVLYLSAKWCELLEENSKQESGYWLLCLLSVWAATVKLSAGMLVFLAVYPAVQLIKTKRWKTIAWLIGCGLVILLPFLIRNVLISGYLLYPYASIDLFSVDWKMAESVVREDSREIRAWGRTMTQREQYDAPFSVWFPAWYNSLITFYRVMFWCSVLGLVGSIFYTFWCIRKSHQWYRLNLLLINAAGLILWFCGAPLIRYGVIYLLLLPIMFTGFLLEKINLQAFSVPGVVILLSYSFITIGQFALWYGRPPVKIPFDYSEREVTVSEVDGIQIYVASKTDQVGYHYFPGVPNQGRLDVIELRTDKLEDGFRLKEEYRDQNIIPDGRVVE